MRCQYNCSLLTKLTNFFDFYLEFYGITKGRILPVDIAEEEGFKPSEVNREYRRVGILCRASLHSPTARSSMPFYLFHQTGEIKLRKFDEKLFAVYTIVHLQNPLGLIFV